MSAKIPPQALEAEQAIIGSLMLDKNAWIQVGDILSPVDFYKPAHQKIYSAVQVLAQKSQPIDLITVSSFLQNSGEFEAIGGHGYLVELLDRTISAANIVEYSRIVKEKSLLRQVITAGTEIIDSAYKEDFVDIDAFVDQAEAKFYNLGETKTTEGLVGPMEVVKNSILKIEEYYNRKAEITGIASGFTLLDKMTSGMHPGELTIIAARPSMGKTAFSLNIAQHVALRQNKTVAYFSLEMGKEAVFMRLLSSEAKINQKDLRAGRISDSHWPKLISAAGVLSDSRFYIDDSASVSPFEVRTRARRLKATTGLDLIIIDYLQFMSLKQKVDSREREVSEISKNLKAIAKELKIPVIALAQLNRGVEGRTEKRPMLSDLRESGSIEQDADVIMMLYREDYYDKEDPDKMGHAEVIIGKQRNGPTGTVKLKFDAEYGRFRDADPDIRQPMPPPPQPQMPGSAPGKPRNFAPGANT
jgi:replicative DNA helicase